MTGKNLTFDLVKLFFLSLEGHLKKLQFKVLANTSSKTFLDVP